MEESSGFVSLLWYWTAVVLQKKEHVVQKALIGPVKAICVLHGYGKWHIASERWWMPNIESNDTSEKDFGQILKKLWEENETKDASERDIM